MIAGFVRDGQSGAALPGAHVYLSELQLGAATNRAGYFAFPELPLGAYRVRVSFVGYATREVELTVEGGVSAVELEPTAIQGSSVVVEAQKQDVESIVPGLLHVPVQQLDLLPSFPGEGDLLQSLQWMPGIRKSGEVSGDLVVRGGEPDQNLYLIEGAPVYHPWHAFSLISTFQTETYDDVRLYRGAFPAEYGGRLASVLDLRMKDGNRSRATATAGISFVSARFVAEAPVGKNGSMMISGRRSYLDKIIGRTHPVEGPDGRRDTLRTGYYFYDVSTKWSLHAGDRHHFSVAYYEGADNLDLRLPFDLSLTFSSWLRPADLFFELGQRWVNRVVSARHQYLGSDRVFLSSTAYYSGYSADENSFVRPTSSSSLTSAYEVDLDEAGFKIDADYYHSVAHQLRFGAHVTHRWFNSGLDASVRPTPGTADELKQRSRIEGVELAIYGQDAWQPTSRLHFLLGARGSYFAKGSYLDLSPSVSARYLIRSSLTAKASAGTHVQYMHRLRDRYSFMYDLVSSRWIPASSGVAPSSSTQLSAGLDYAPLAGLTLSADSYWRHSRDILIPRDQYDDKDGLDGPGIEVGALLGQYTPATGRAFGVEASARIERRDWNALAAYSRGRMLNRAAEIDSTGYHPSRFDIPRELRLIAALTPGSWSLSAALDLRSGYPYSVPIARYAVSDPLDDEPVQYLHRPFTNNGRLPVYRRLDVGVAYQFKLLRAYWSVDLQIYNVLNHRNIVSRSFDPAGNVVRVTDRRGLPILPLLEIKVTL